MKYKICSRIQESAQHSLKWVLPLIIGLVACKSSPPPENPVMTPNGPEIKIMPSKKEAISVSSTGASKYRWSLQGDGELSSLSGPNIFYTAPKDAGGLAILTVTAYNDDGDSSQNALTINVATLDSVRMETLAIPAGWMSGGGDPASFIRLESSPNRCLTGSDCRRFTYRPGGGWGGIYWWPISCGESGTPVAWDRVRRGACGTNLPKAANLSLITSLTFWARGERGGGGYRV